MSAIVDILAGIGNFFATIGDFIVNVFSDLIYVISLLAKFTLEIPGYFSWLPSQVITSLVTLFGVVVIYMVLNRK